MPVERFEQLPAPSLLRALWPRARRLDPAGPPPDLQVEVEGVSAGEVEQYGDLTGFAIVDPLPLTWPQVRAVGLHLHMFTHASAPVPALGLVHVASRIEQHQPIPRAARMDLTCAWTGQRLAAQGVELDLTTTARVGGALAWRSVTTVLSRGAQRDPEAPRRDDGAPIERPTRSTSWRLPEDLGRRYARVAGDFNPIHQAAWAARPFGFKRHIIHGMWTLARALAELDDALPGAPCVVTATFRRPVSLPGTVIFEAGPAPGGQAFVVRSRDARKVHLHGEVISGGL